MCSLISVMSCSSNLSLMSSQLKFLLKIFLFYVFAALVYVYLSTLESGARGGQSSLWDPLELELQTVVRLYMGVGY